MYALLGADHDKSPYTQTGERIARIAAGGVRLVIGDLRTDVTKTRKDGTRGRLRYEYGDHRDPRAAIAWLWKFLDAAKTAGELYGRALCPSRHWLDQRQPCPPDVHEIDARNNDSRARRVSAQGDHARL